MMTTTLIILARFLWGAAVIRWSVNWLRERGSERDDLTFSQAFWTALGLLVLERVCGTVGLFPGLGLGSWAVFLALWFGTFAIYHRLGFVRTLMLIPLQALGMLLFGLLLRIAGLPS